MDPEKRYWLNRYIVKKRRIEILAKRLGELDSGSEYLRSVSYSGMPSVKRDTSITEKQAIKKIELEERINCLKIKAREIKTEILEAIDSMDDPTRADILERHFILDQSLPFIAEDMDFTERHVIRLYSRAVSEIDLTKWIGDRPGDIG